MEERGIRGGGWQRCDAMQCIMEHLDWPAAPLENPTSHSSAGAIWYMPSGPQPSARSAQLPTVDCGQMLPFPPRPEHGLRHIKTFLAARGAWTPSNERRLYPGSGWVRVGCCMGESIFSPPSGTLQSADQLTTEPPPVVAGGYTAYCVISAHPCTECLLSCQFQPQPTGRRSLV